KRFVDKHSPIRFALLYRLIFFCNQFRRRSRRAVLIFCPLAHEPALKLERRVSHGAGLHDSHEIEDVAALSPTPRLDPPMRLACPSVLFHLDAETLFALVRGVHWERAAPAEIGLVHPLPVLLRVVW